MTRGGRRKDRDEPERRCIVTGESGGVFGLIRFVIGPEGDVLPDLAERLPGRGMWLTASREALAQAIKRRAFSRAARAQVATPEGLEDLVERLLAKRATDSLALARKAGLAVTGFEKVKARLRKGPVAALMHARDGSDQGLGKLLPLRGDAPVVNVLSSDELGLAFGRDYVIHAALDAGGAAERFLREATRLSGFRPESPGATRAPQPRSEESGQASGRAADDDGAPGHAEEDADRGAD